jgi:hypothetical protein
VKRNATRERPAAAGRRAGWAAALLGLAISVPSEAQQRAADPADVGSIDAILAAVYDVISGPPGERDWDRMRTLFAPGARLIVAVPDSAGGAEARVRTLEEYVAGNAPFFRENGFFEREISRRTESFGHVAHVFSTYESRRDAGDPEPFARGINSIQLLRDGGRWWIVTIYWDSERPGNPIPGRYLPSGGDAAGGACAGAPYARLDFWLGEWDVLDPRGVRVGANRIEKALGGCAVREEWTDVRAARGSSVFWYSRPEARWRQVWVTDAGAFKEKGEVAAPGPGAVRFQGEVTAPDGSTVLDRTTLTPAGEGRVRQLIEVSRDGGRTWSATFDGLYVPAPAASAAGG